MKHEFCKARIGMQLTYFHNILVRVEFFCVVIPTNILSVLLALYLSLAGGAVGVFFAFLYAGPTLFTGLCLAHFFRCFEGETERGLLAPIYIGAYIALVLGLFHQYDLGLYKKPDDFLLWLVVIGCLTAVAVHWLCLYCFRFRMPRRNVLRKLPNHI